MGKLQKCKALRPVDILISENLISKLLQITDSGDSFQNVHRKPHHIHTFNLFTRSINYPIPCINCYYSNDNVLDKARWRKHVLWITSGIIVRPAKTINHHLLSNSVQAFYTAVV